MSAGTMNETQPLLQHQSRAYFEHQDEDIGKDIVQFDPNGDPENPREWPHKYKWFIVFLLAFMAFTVTFTCISVVPVANRIVYDLDGRASKSASVLLVTIWELGEAVGPLFIAPLSEIFGRYPLTNAANLLFITAVMLAALSQSTPLFIAARALTGLAVASNVLNPAIVGDVFVPEERGSAMSLIMLAPLLGGALGPAVAGVVAEKLGWRYVLWMSAGLAGICEVFFLTCFRETYEVTILKRRAATLRWETGNDSLRTVYDDDVDRGLKKLWDDILRPAIVLFDSGVLQALSLFGSVAFAYFYVMSTTLPDILEDIYKLSPALTGVSFISFSLGSAISVVLCRLLLDRIYVKLRDHHKVEGQPEYRLPLVIIGGFTLPLTVSSYGWIAQRHLPMPLPLFATALLGFTLLFTYIPLMTYVVDAFGRYSASAMTGLIIARCLMGTFLPLVVEPLVHHFGYGLGLSIIAAASLCLAPIPLLVSRYGLRWRKRSKYTTDKR